MNSYKSLSEYDMLSILAHSSNATALYTGDTIVIEYANHAMLKFWGKESDIIGMTMEEGVPELKGQPFIDILKGVWQTGLTYEARDTPAKLMVEAELKVFYFDFIYKAIKDQEGNMLAILHTAIDVTEQVKSKIDLVKAGEKLRFAIESANAGTWTRDLRRGDFIPSTRYKELFGFGAEEDMPYEATLGFIHEDFRELVIAARERAIKDNVPYSLEYPIILNEDKVKWLKSYGKVENDSTGNFPMLSGIVLDITEQKLDEIRKNDFIAIVSHELKTPLTSLKGYTQLLNHKAKKDGDEFTVGTLTRIENQVNKMHTLINGFLNVSRLEAGKITLDKKTFDLHELIIECIEETRTTTSKHVFNIGKIPAVSVHADREKIWAVVCNLLSNAVKYAPGGGDIDIDCIRQEDIIQVSIKDEGMGIRPYDLEKLFDRFYRVENERSNSITGFGIGLYLSAEIIKGHQGKIWAESEFGQGATFHFAIPL